MESQFWLYFFFFYKCGDNDTSVATFVATLIKTLDTTAVERESRIKTLAFLLK